VRWTIEGVCGVEVLQIVADADEALDQTASLPASA
jgi:hypothetical protein